jgi:hypothetical protein
MSTKAQKKQMQQKLKAKQQWREANKTERKKMMHKQAVKDTSTSTRTSNITSNQHPSNQCPVTRQHAHSVIPMCLSVIPMCLIDDPYSSTNEPNNTTDEVVNESILSDQELFENRLNYELDRINGEFNQYKKIEAIMKIISEIESSGIEFNFDFKNPDYDYYTGSHRDRTFLMSLMLKVQRLSQFSTYEDMRLFITIIKIVLNKKIDINAVDEGGRSVLMYVAAYVKDTIGREICKLLIDINGIDINKQDINGWTALMHGACALAHINAWKHIPNREVVICLIDAGADVEIRSNSGRTARKLMKDRFIWDGVNGTGSLLWNVERELESKKRYIYYNIAGDIIHKD